MIKKSIVGYFKIFGCKCFILNIKEHLEKFDKKFDEGIFLGYCENIRGFRVYNRRTLVIEEAIHVTFDESNDDVSKSCCEEDDVGVHEGFKKLIIHDQDNAPLEENSKEDDLQENQALEEKDKDVGTPRDFLEVWKFVQNHPKELIVDTKILAFSYSFIYFIFIIFVFILFYFILFFCLFYLSFIFCYEN